MRITDEQKIVLDQLKCERISKDENNLRAVEDFLCARNENLMTVLQGQAYEEDENDVTAYYLVKDADNNILFYFSLRCGALYDEFVEYERLNKLRMLCDHLASMRKDSNLSEVDAKEIDGILEKIRGKKGIKKTDITRRLNIPDQSQILDEIFRDDGMTVGITYPGIEIVHFCANAKYKDKWNQLGLGQKLGVVVFWLFIVSIVQEIMKHIGCEYLYLFAADWSEDQELVNYYRANLNFTDTENHATAIPLYDFACKFLYQKTKDLGKNKESFFENFNRDEDAV